MRRSIFASLLLLPVAAALLAADAPSLPAEAIEKSRLEGMLTEGDTGMVQACFRRHPGRTLPFIDQYFEGGLAMIEKEGAAAQSKALESYRTGIRFAKLADETFGESIFSEYANAFASWSPTEQKRFREGQRLFREGMKTAKEDRAAAIKLLNESLRLAESLGDWWGQAMAHSGIAQTALAGGSEADLQHAFEAAARAVQINARLRLQEDCVQALLVSASAREPRGGREGVSQLRDAWTIASKDSTIDAELRTNVRDRFLAALDRAGMADAAQKLRREEAIE